MLHTFALQSNEARATFASISVKFIVASGSVLTWFALAVVRHVLAILAFVAWHTVAFVSIHQVDTGSIICARVFFTIVHIHVAVFASPSRVTNAFIVVQAINANAIGTWFREAQVNLFMASLSSKSVKKVIKMSIILHCYSA